MEQSEYDEMLRTLVRIAAHQETINEDFRAMLSSHEARLITQEALLARQDSINDRLTAAIERLESTQARIETLLSRMIRQQDNGREG
jgi:hypothetical protein